jgi:CRISPR-associated protein Cmr1
MGIKTINCKLITPMLMHGEDTSVAELRPPSIKGAIRFWWRAVHGNLTLEELKKQESKLFGGAGEDTAVKSSFRIKLITTSLKTEQIDPLPHKNNRFKISGYKENQNFKITLIGRELDIIEKIFKLASILGGLGQRSRRGFGSIQIQDSISEEYIKNLIEEINPSFNYSSDNAYPYIKNIEIGKEYQDMNLLIKTISSATHNHNRDGMFGSVKNGRYASPIYISVIKDSQKYRPVITTLNATKRIDDKRLQEFKGAIL